MTRRPMTKRLRHRAAFALGLALAGLAAALGPLVACDEAPAAAPPASADAAGDGESPRDATLRDAADAGDAGDAGDGGPMVEAPHAPYPQVTYGGGPVLANAHLVVITFAGDPMSGVVDDFASSVTASAWWRTVTDGACDDAGCVSTARRVDLVTLPLGPPSSSPDGGDAGASYDQPSVQGILHDAIASGAVPRPDEDAVYVLAFPLGVFLTTLDVYGNVLTGCSSFASYHHELYIGDIAFEAGGGAGVRPSAAHCPSAVLPSGDGHHRPARTRARGDSHRPGGHGVRAPRRGRVEHLLRRRAA